MSVSINSQDLFLRSQKVSPGGVHSPVRAFKSVGGSPLFFKSAEGAYITSVEGNRYIDFCQAFGPNILGHRHPEIMQAAHHALELAGSMGSCEPYSLDLAEQLVKTLPFIEKVRFTCSGTEAVMSALRLARGATNRSIIVKFDGCYHGHVDSLLVKSGSGLAGIAVSDSAGVPADVAQTTVVCPLDDEIAFKQVMEKHGQNVAAVILEPLPANYGMLLQRKEFIKSVVEIARAQGSLVIFDEVISGFRVGYGGMVEDLGITPDLITFGKIMGGGFAVGAYAGPARYMDLIAPSGPVYQAGTLAAHPIGMLAGLKTLQIVSKPGFYANLEATTKSFVNSLNDVFERSGCGLTSVSKGSIFWIHPKVKTVIRKPTDIPASAKETFAKLFHALLKQGVYLPPSAYEVCFVSTAHTQNVLDETLNKFDSALRAM